MNRETSLWKSVSFVAVPEGAPPLRSIPFALSTVNSQTLSSFVAVPPPSLATRFKKKVKDGSAHFGQHSKY